MAFCLIMKRLNVTSCAREVVDRSTDSLEVLRSASLDDRSKEKALRSHAVRLFVLCGVITGGGLIALLTPIAGLWALERAGVGSVQGALSVLARGDFLIGTAVLALLVYLAGRRVDLA